MAQSPRLEGRVDLATGPPRAPLSEPMNDECGMPSLHMDWDVARITKANLILIGAEQLGVERRIFVVVELQRADRGSSS